MSKKPKFTKKQQGGVLSDTTFGDLIRTSNPPQYEVKISGKSVYLSEDEYYDWMERNHPDIQLPPKARPMRTRKKVRYPDKKKKQTGGYLEPSIERI